MIFMKILIFTQKIDVNDPVLGFFCRWIEEFAKNFEKITVVCLQKGEYNLPPNVKVLSLGKDKLTAFKKIKYILNFYKHIWRERKNYDVVFVHMNQEYALLGGIFWKISGKKIYMWRNHHSGSLLTDIASVFCKKVFCTSKYSYTAKYKKTVLMPVGVDIQRFKIKNEISKIKNSILFLGRIAPSKNVDIFVEALGILKKQNLNFSGDIYGDVLPEDVMYLEKIKSRVCELGLESVLKFHSGVPNRQTPEIYNSHEIFVNLSSSGMYDKTIFEAMSCGCLALASNNNLKGQIDDRFIIAERKAEEVTKQISIILSLSEEEKQKIISDNIKFAEMHSLEELAGKLSHIVNK
ncbi:MAG: Glycosyltransferase [Parcubacteria group bacterium GW2011_GWA1_40_21]|nr:MAG: Glycosyltransferase [Parcubacteria group bacterium GW2011_GWA1_40_21]